MSVVNILRKSSENNIASSFSGEIIIWMGGPAVLQFFKFNIRRADNILYTLLKFTSTLL
jgi:hypothetical protein